MNAAGNSNESSAVETAQASSAEPALPSLTPGELLRKERERRSLTQLHIAEELHLDARVVAAIEDNRFEQMGPAVYARGHLRQYAALLGLSPQLIIERYEALTGVQEIPAPIPASVASAPIDMERRSLAGPLWSGVGLIALSLGWWLWSTVSTPGDPMQTSIPDEAVTEAGSLPSTLPPEPADSTEPAVQPPPPVSNVVPATATTASPTAALQVRLRLQFNDASWTEIYDATGKRLMFGLGESGKVSALTGVPPIRVTLGKASAVTVQVNDSPVVVPRRAGRDAAKFVVTANGTVEMMSAQASGEVPVE
ncbi:cytoskeleton protein RodZ [Steroidobacter agaridevorans]|uniref:Cytoskeleton protein RodZ n=1 Tax=Steroidobacter agaridevorans TaxID=2695856 RepID=A0A829YAJ9_9GAMM|nr:helix-turn-helix domain-containing protein [Steroidobacter agaridevorans]GFE80374.1 cytoskeleton protein RodZ [Steroidobacter agaridevorans]GFE87430.1 cytoskeleton protein RodZ [Steroidobacter agaridevorans]